MQTKALNFLRARGSRFENSLLYWENRYREGGNSGVGSYGHFAEFKAEVLNRFVFDNEIYSVIEFGCGDGNQLSLAKYPRYIGIDVSPTAVETCKRRFQGDETKMFLSSSDAAGLTAELAISLDVIYHLVEDDVFHSYIANLFASAQRFVILYCSSFPKEQLSAINSRFPKHVRHRSILQYVAATFPHWRLIRQIPNRYPYNWRTQEGSFADFFLFAKAC